MTLDKWTNSDVFLIVALIIGAVLAVAWVLRKNGTNTIQEQRELIDTLKDRIESFEGRLQDQEDDFLSKLKESATRITQLEHDLQLQSMATTAAEEQVNVLKEYAPQAAYEKLEKIMEQYHDRTERLIARGHQDLMILLSGKPTGGASS